MQTRKITFNIQNLNLELVPGVLELAPVAGFDVSQGESPPAGGLCCSLTAQSSANNTITITDNACHITYSTTPAFFKGLSVLAARLSSAADNSFTLSYNADFTALGAMFDCSRNSVLSVSGAKKIIRLLALMGYNFIMLYTEDTLEVPGYPHFGYLRGRYTKSEIKEIDDYCRLFGIELIPCIQTLAHLNCAFNWQPFKDIHDIDDILLVDHEPTYEFLDALIGACAASFTSHQIHIGMDEAHHVGLGRYLDEHGFTDRVELMLRHLGRVAAICEKHGLSPMMWSDMFFRLLYGDYFEFDETAAKGKTLPKIAVHITMVYWDYFSFDTARYDKFFRAHQTFASDTVFAGGAWTWKGFTPDNRFSIPATRAALASARANGIKRVFATLWGDDGGECCALAVLPTLVVYSDENYHTGDLEREFEVLSSGISFTDYLFLDAPACFPGIAPDCSGLNPAKYFLFQDLLAGMTDLNGELEPGALTKKYQQDAAALSQIAGGAAGDFATLFTAHALLCDVLSIKAELGREIRLAYKNGDRSRLSDISSEIIPLLITKTEALYEHIKKTWTILSKPHGLEVQDLRYGGIIQRFKSVKQVLDEYLSGSMPQIELLEEELLPYCAYGMSKPGDYIYAEQWFKMYSPAVPFHG